MTDSGVFRPSSILPPSGVFLPLDADGGLQLDLVKPGTILEVKTKNNAYTVIPQESGETLLWGHPQYCPEPVSLWGVGSSYVTGVFREGYLGTGMRLTFPSGGRRVVTSRIVSIQAKKRN